jgi:hypothetical protein
MDALDARRREFLLGLGKWSVVVIGAVVGAGLMHSAAEGGWINSRGGWGGGWVNAVGGGGGGWLNSRGGGGWINAR